MSDREASDAGVRYRRVCFSITMLILAACDAEEAAPLRVVGGDARRGQAVILDAGCSACHVIPGIRGVAAWVGPPLTEWSRRGYVGGRLPNVPENLVAWLLDPGAISPGSAMPSVGLSEAAARDAAAYLFTLGATRLPAVPAGMPLGPHEGGPRETPRLRPRA
jgi:cytochrome c2